MQSTNVFVFQVITFLMLCFVQYSDYAKIYYRNIYIYITSSLHLKIKSICILQSKFSLVSFCEEDLLHYTNMWKFIWHILKKVRNFLTRSVSPNKAIKSQFCINTIQKFRNKNILEQYRKQIIYIVLLIKIVPRTPDKIN